MSGLRDPGTSSRRSSILSAAMPAVILIGGLGLLVALFVWLSASVPRERVAADADQERLVTLRRTSFARLPGWTREDFAGFKAAFERSCSALASEDPSAPMRGLKLRSGAPLAGTVGDWHAVCAEAAKFDEWPTDARAFVEGAFVPVKVKVDGTDEGLFTGYFEPEYLASRERAPGYTTPLHGLPPDLLNMRLREFGAALPDVVRPGRVKGRRFVPYPTREEIKAGALPADTPVVAWMASPVDAFFLEIQGSGRLALTDGGVMRVGYAGKNGRPYVAIGKTLIERGALERGEVTMQSIRAWLTANPGEAQSVMNSNPSYVFFRENTELDPSEGPLGAQGVPLEPERSLAVDPQRYPYGLPIYAVMPRPEVADRGRVPSLLEGERVYARLFVAQDTGGAIRGTIRGDVYFGSGSEAGEIAGVMQQRGEMYVMIPRVLADRLFESSRRVTLRLP